MGADMNAVTLLAELKEQGVDVIVQRGDLLVGARRGALTPEICAVLSELKSEIVGTLRRAGEGPLSPLAEYAASVLPKIRLAVHETGDTKRDFDLLGEIRQLIREYQPGGNHVYLRIVPLEGEPIMVEWRALADRELRMALGRLLARAAQKERTR